MSMLARFAPTVACALISLFSVSLVSTAAHADQDHERARQARLAGQVKPLSEVLQMVEREQPGQVLEVELEHEHGQWVYEIKLLAPDGRLHKLYVNAASAQLIHPKQPDNKED